MAKKSPVFLFVPLIFLIDRITKLLIIGRLDVGEGLAIWPGVFHLTRVNNTGAAFGFLREYPGALTLFTAACLSLMVLYYFKSAYLDCRRMAMIEHAGWALVIAGTAGNLADRLRYGYIIDFLDLRVWPVFNVADTAICVGAALIALHLCRSSKELS